MRVLLKGISSLRLSVILNLYKVLQNQLRAGLSTYLYPVGTLQRYAILMIGGVFMLSYNIEIHGNDNGEIFYSVTLQNGTRHEPEKFNCAKTAFIYSTVDKLADALKELSATAKN
ncbi:MAG: hypothetical protein IJM47_09005 [Synergistaceae bacterium]|nr:hypothetical protein [Synergistaceae bacterium]